MSAWRYVFACLGAVLLACAAKNYLAVWLYNTFLCEYLCPSVFAKGLLESVPVLDAVYRLQHAVGRAVQEAIALYWNDPYQVVTFLGFAPVVEEVLYRGPLYVTRTARNGALWWALAFLLTLVFALSHERSGVALLPVGVLGMSAAWLIRVTGRFWPCVALHFLQNLYQLSFTVYQSSLWGL